MKRLLLWSILGLLIFPTSVFAAADQDPGTSAEKKEATTIEAGTETETERSKVYMKIGEITVSEKADYLSTADVPGSVDVIGSDQIGMENVDFSMELLKKVPGVYYGDWNQGVVSGTASMRGFDANHDSPTTLIVDGIDYGRLDIQPFFPLEIDRIEAVKGTFDPSCGYRNIGGNIKLHTKRGGNETEARILTGSYNTYDAGLITSNDDGNFSQTYFVGYRETDGYRDHSDLRKGAASGKWFYTTDDEKLSVGAIARFFGMDANAPGYLTKEQAATTPTMAASFAFSDGGQQENRDVSTHVDYQFSDQLAWSVKSYFQQYQKIRWCRWSDAGAQQERFNDEDQYGFVSTFSYETTDTFIPSLKIDWGLDYKHRDEISARYVTDNRVRQGGPTQYYDMSWYYWGSYLQADGDVNKWLRLTAALRVDSFDGEMTNGLSGLTTDMIDMDYIWQPKFGFIVTPKEGYNLYGNYGRAFQLPSAPTLYGQNSGGSPISSDFSYSKNDGWELGVKASPTRWLSTRVDYWQMVASDEVRSKNDGSGDYVNAGETERKGWDFSVSVRPHDWVSVWGSYSIIEAEYTDPGPGRESIRGNDIENIPEYTAKAGIDFTHPSGFFSNLWLDMQGDQEIDSANLKEPDGEYRITNWSLGYKWKKATVGLEIKNLFDENYSSFIWDNDSGYNPGDARSFYLWTSLSY